MLFITSGRGAFKPPKIPNCVAWLRSDQGLDSGQVDNTGAPNWRSIIPGGADCSQATGSKQPVWRSSGGINGRPFLSLNGSRAYVWALDLHGTASVFMVFRLTSTGAAQTVFCYKRVTGGTSFSEYQVEQAAGGYPKSLMAFDYNSVSTVSGYNPTLGTTNGHWTISTYNGGSQALPSSYTELLDNSSQTLVSGGPSGRTSTDPGSLFARMDVSQNISNGCRMEFYEIGVWSRVISSGEKSMLANYVNKIYGL